jgi:hypothetical protein
LIYRYVAAPGAATFVQLMAAVALWCLTSAFHGLAPTLDEKILWAKVQYVGICAVPPLWFIFLTEYVGSPSGDDRRLRLALAAIAVVTILLAFTNDAHHLVWSSVQLSAAGTAIYNHAVWFWFAAAYHYVLMFGGLIVLVGALRRTPAVFKGQIFNPFFTTKQTGHGLGRAAIQGIVRGHRGALRIKSDLNRGSTFRVWFPAATTT